MSESVVQVVQGDSLDPKGRECIFCGRVENPQLFSVSLGKRHNGTLLRHFPVCEEHLDKLNALLSGEYEIDAIQLDKYRKQSLNLRFRG